MKTVKVNAKGLACPQPVVLSRKALAEIESGEVVVYVDSETARDNVKRMAEHEGCMVKVDDQGSDGFVLQLTKVASVQVSKEVAADKKSVAETFVYLFDADFIGSNRELGKVLVNGFLNALTSLENRKGKMIFISNGVKLAIADSYVLETLTKLEDGGFEILICGTCLDFFKLRERVQVGAISNALEIMEALTGADKIIKF